MSIPLFPTDTHLEPRAGPGEASEGQGDQVPESPRELSDGLPGRDPRRRTQQGLALATLEGDTSTAGACNSSPLPLPLRASRAAQATVAPFECVLSAKGLGRLKGGIRCLFSPFTLETHEEIHTFSSHLVILGGSGAKQEESEKTPVTPSRTMLLTS